MADRDLLRMQIGFRSAGQHFHHISDREVCGAGRLTIDLHGARGVVVNFRAANADAGESGDRPDHPGVSGGGDASAADAAVIVAAVWLQASSTHTAVVLLAIARTHTSPAH